jgi:hypothetical protein
MKDFIKQLCQQMEEDLAFFTDLGTPGVSKLTGGLNCVQGYMTQLKNYIQLHPFETEAEEIDFFKNQKPRFYCWNIYLVEEYGIQNNLPKGSSQMLRAYYLQELTYLERNFNHYRSIYQYYLDNETYKDEGYFLRSNLIGFQAGQEYLPPDPAFSTNQDFLFSRFRAAGMLQDFIIRQIRLLENAPDELLCAKRLQRKTLRWTGEKINLAELAYGIYFTGQLNDGKAEVMEIIEWLEESLVVELSKAQAYRMFLDIRRRKTISYTKFIDHMRDAIHRHIDDSNSYKPKKSASKK